jgi:hypothetical protein
MTCLKKQVKMSLDFVAQECNTVSRTNYQDKICMGQYWSLVHNAEGLLDLTLNLSELPAEDVVSQLEALTEIVARYARKSACSDGLADRGTRICNADFWDSDPSSGKDPSLPNSDRSRIDLGSNSDRTRIDLEPVG